MAGSGLGASSSSVLPTNGSELGDEADARRQRCGDRRQQDVAVADVRDLVRGPLAAPQV
jgi:hypothetical protein